METTLWRAACAAVALATLLTVPSRWQCEGVDEIEYLSLARSLERGDGYTIDGQPHVLYPPLFPFLLAGVQRLAGAGAWPILYGVNAAAGVAGLLLLASWLRTHYGRPGRWAAWFALTAYYPWSFATRYLLSEPLFFLLGSLSLIAADRLRRGRKSAGASLPLLVLLSAMTRAGALALVGGQLVSLVLGAWRRHRADLLGAAVAIGVLAIGFFAFWEWRAASLQPDASESYGRWARALIGLGGNETSFVGRSPGEGLEEATTPVQRAVVEGVKLGQYVASIVRAPDAFKPLALLIAGFLLWGLFHELRGDPDSPLAWYAAATLGLVVMTSWVSSYHRYFFPLTPIWWWLLLRGIRAWTDGGSGVRLRGLASILMALIGLVWALAHFATPGGSGAEVAYLRAIGAASLGFYLLLLVAGVRMVWIEARIRVDGRMLAVALILLTLHNLVLAGQRHRLVRADATLRDRQLDGPLALAEWLRANAGPADTAVASLPRLVSLMADREATWPRYRGEQLDPQTAGWVMLLGPDVQIPAFSAAREQDLAQGVVRLEAEGRARRERAEGRAVLYRVVSAASN